MSAAIRANIDSVSSPPDWRDASSEFTSWFGKSRVVDKDDRPLIVYRGEHGEGYLEHRAASIAFGSLSTANCYALHPNDSREVPLAPKIIPAFLRIEKPFVNDANDPFVDLSRFVETLGLRRAIEIAREFADHVEHTNNWEDNFSQSFDGVDALLRQMPERLFDLYANIYPFLDDPQIVRELCGKDFDGAIYAGSGENALEAEYRVFSTNQIRSAIHAKVPSRPSATQKQMS